MRNFAMLPEGADDSNEAMGMAVLPAPTEVMTPAGV